MKWYGVWGTDRQVGAIGIMETFSIKVQAESFSEAHIKARALRYESGREHVLIKGSEEIKECLKRRRRDKLG